MGKRWSEADFFKRVYELWPDTIEDIEQYMSKYQDMTDDDRKKGMKELAKKTWKFIGGIDLLVPVLNKHYRETATLLEKQKSGRNTDTEGRWEGVSGILLSAFASLNLLDYQRLTSNKECKTALKSSQSTKDVTDLKPLIDLIKRDLKRGPPK
ncbi:MAG: hypothetical protein ACFE89_03465 [Candidatus Hodarchaeota archaeon]